MRNWNLQPLHQNVCTSLVLSLPMRNWNNIETTPCLGNGLVLSLPMRNWNPAILLYIKLFYSGFWAYLWGIETINLLNFFTFLKSFEPTYEELKLVPACLSFFPFYRRFEPTYEELKRGFLYLTFGKFRCFEPTYEELKLGKRIVFKTNNGGFEPTYEELKLKIVKLVGFIRPKFWAYLWGIETFISTLL